jgi:3-hydroxymyristoyl/3-hydroxydecanoyl-(acyl carrier protein) dehydratase
MIPLPRILGHETGPEERFVLLMEPGALAFQGHFPGHPILPGVVQVDWAIQLGAQAFGPLGAFRRISNLKFMGLIQPGDTVDLRLTWTREKGKLGFQYLGESGRKSSGTVEFDA